MHHLLTILLFAPLALTSAIIPRHYNAAAYFLDNNPNGSSIVAMQISPQDGTLSNPIRTSTGGKGMFGLSAPAANSTAAPMAGNVDTLFSQNAVIVSGNYLFTINAGSNTLAMFSIESNDPLHPCMVGGPVDTMGEFPMSVTYSSKLHTACVLNGGAKAGISCFSVDPLKGLQPMGSLRPIDLNQTTPPVGPAGTGSDILFSPSSESLLATIKGNGTGPGSILNYPISERSISTTPVPVQSPQILLNFGMSFLSSSRLVIADPSAGASIVPFPEARNNNSTQLAQTTLAIPVTSQKAICWTEYNPARNEIYLMDAGVSNITVADASTGKLTKVLSQDAAGLGSLDAKLEGNSRYLYVLKTAAEIGVVDTVTGESVQRMNLTGLGSRQGFMGMAVWGKV